MPVSTGQRTGMSGSWTMLIRGSVWRILMIRRSGGSLRSGRGGEDGRGRRWRGISEVLSNSHLIPDRCIAPRFDKIAEKDYNAYMLKGCHRLNGQASEQDSKKWLAAQFGRPGRLFSFLWSFRLSRRIVWTTPITVAKAPMNATISSAASIISITSVWWIWHNSPVGGRIFSRPPTIKARKARPLTTHKALRVTSLKEIESNFRHDFHRIIGDLNEFLPYNSL